MTTSTLINFDEQDDSTARSYDLVDPTPVSDEDDDLVAALLARDRLHASARPAVSLEDSIRAFGLDPGQLGLE